MARRALVAASLLTLALAACGGGGSSDENGPARAAALLGVTSGALTDPGAPVAAEVRVMADSGVTALRVPFYWARIEPVRGKFDFSSVDPFVEACARGHIELLPIALRAPAWAAAHPKLANSPPAGTRDYAAFLTTLIERYGPDGSFWSAHPSLPKQPIETWQIWNEPNHDHYWSDQPYAAGYVRLARAARAAIKKADPDALVVAAGFADRSWESIAQIYRAGAKGVFDAVAIHPYTYEVANVLRLVRFARTEPVGSSTRRPEKLNGLEWSRSVEIQFSQKMRSTPSSRRWRISSGSACARRFAWSGSVVSNGDGWCPGRLPDDQVTSVSHSGRSPSPACRSERRA